MRLCRSFGRPPLTWRRRVLGAVLAPGLLLPSLADARTSAAPTLTLTGDPTPLITDAQRAQLGLKFGPDAPVDFFRARDGQYYINAAGSLGPQRGPGRPAAWNLHVDPGLTRILALHGQGPATGPGDVQTIMTDHAAECGAGRSRLRAADPGGAACMAYFDRDYAGGGAYFRCPDGVTSVYFYHGENHTSPDGGTGKGGWFGLGVGAFNASETAVTRLSQMPLPGGGSTAQIAGMNVSTIWRGPGRGAAPPPQANPYNGVPSIVASADGYLYMYHGNATFDPAANPSACRPECMSVSRAPTAGFCRGVATGHPIAWQNYDRGGWTQPAMLGASSSLGFGAGGAFTPLIPNALPGEYGGTVTYLPQHRLYVMVRLQDGGITIRTSRDGLGFSPARKIVAAPAETTPNGDAEQIVYPKLAVLPAPDGGERCALTYVVATRGRFWRWAALMRQSLDIRDD